MFLDRICGVALLILCAVYIAIARNSSNIGDRDISAIVFLLPMALYLIFNDTEIITYRKGK